MALTTYGQYLERRYLSINSQINSLGYSNQNIPTTAAAGQVAPLREAQLAVTREYSVITGGASIQDSVGIVDTPTRSYPVPLANPDAPTTFNTGTINFNTGFSATTNDAVSNTGSSQLVRSTTVAPPSDAPPAEVNVQPYGTLNYNFGGGSGTVPTGPVGVSTPTIVSPASGLNRSVGPAAVPTNSREPQFVQRDFPYTVPNPGGPDLNGNRPGDPAPGGGRYTGDFNRNTGQYLSTESRSPNNITAVEERNPQTGSEFTTTTTPDRNTEYSQTDANGNNTATDLNQTITPNNPEYDATTNLTQNEIDSGVTPGEEFYRGDDLWRVNPDGQTAFRAGGLEGAPPPPSRPVGADGAEPSGTGTGTGNSANTDAETGGAPPLTVAKKPEAPAGPPC